MMCGSLSTMQYDTYDRYDYDLLEKKMNRVQYLNKVSDTLNKRELTYGKPIRNFKDIAKLWSGYKGVDFDVADVCYMMMLLKISRAKEDPTNEDTLVDIAGYSALLTELIYGNPNSSELRKDQQNTDSKIEGLDSWDQ